MVGAGYRFATSADACTAFLVALFAAGAKRIDVGIAKINMGWNGHRFGSRFSPCVVNLFVIDIMQRYKELHRSIALHKTCP